MAYKAITNQEVLETAPLRGAVSLEIKGEFHA
jgi:hypothetical protein